MTEKNPMPRPVTENDVTPEATFQNRRQVLKALGFGGIASLAAAPLAWGGGLLADDAAAKSTGPTFPGAVGDGFNDLFPPKRNTKYSLGSRPLTPEPIASTYNNFYEFTTNQARVWRLAKDFDANPWTVRVTGKVKKEFKFGLEELFRWFPLEERLYRFRCVEAWAMQVPWSGFPLKKLIEKCEPLGSAKYMRVVSPLDEARFPGQKKDKHYPWPYYEAFRIDEATHDLAFVALGIYGHTMPMQHGAPWRVVMPWKYGFKSPKTLVEIHFSETKPGTFWNDFAPKEYGFFSNVNPAKPHPRWSQATERDIGTQERRDTLIYNGYADEVASMYTGEEF